MQVALVAKLAAYDKNFAARSGERTRIMVLTIKGDGDSIRTSGQGVLVLARAGGGCIDATTVYNVPDMSSGGGDDGAAGGDAGEDGRPLDESAGG